jgi:hypothetical protein
VRDTERTGEAMKGQKRATLRNDPVQGRNGWVRRNERRRFRSSQKCLTSIEMRSLPSRSLRLDDADILIPSIGDGDVLRCRHKRLAFFQFPDACCGDNEICGFKRFTMRLPEPARAENPKRTVTPLEAFCLQRLFPASSNLQHNSGSHLLYANASPCAR